eukprot:TRINITY_DN9768_c0_g1_i1.p1 TRINITY_DN9768_c0_g1~~TRINITY_DN9768_c0_g1_i1.p1  ORF type:complete len:324 (+),score=94.81 TRINITY_DN9768_c0_g1_i1:42-1013(+)
MAQAFLSSVKVEDIIAHLPTSPNMVSFDADASLPHVLKTLIEKNILSAPVVKTAADAAKPHPHIDSLIGVVTMLDLVIYLTQNVLSDKSSMSHNMKSLFEETEKILMQSTHASALVDLSKTAEAATISKGSSVWDAIQVFARESVHRLLVTDNDGSIIQFLTQSAVLRFLSQNLEKLGGRLDQTLAQAGLAGHVTVFCIEDKEKAVEAFKLISSEKLSAVGVVDAETGKLIGNISSRDIRMIREDAEFIQRLYLPASAFLIKMQKTYNVPETPVTATGKETVRQTIERLGQFGIHRVYVVDEQNKPQRVVSMTDLLQFIGDEQ